MSVPSGQNKECVLIQRQTRQGEDLLQRRTQAESLVCCDVIKFVEIL